jgi:hypothetical protein
MAIDTPLVLLLVAYIVIGIIAWYILKKIIGVIITLSVFTMIVMSVFGVFVYKDILDMKANLKNGNVVILFENEEVLSGFSVIDSSAQVLSKEQLTLAGNQIKNNDLEALKGASYKLFIMDPKAIEQLEDPEFSLEGDSLAKEQALSILRSSDPKNTLEGYSISTDSSSEEVKAELLAQSFEHIVKNPVTMITQIKSRNLKVYEETALFKAMKYIPLAFIKSAVASMVEGTKEVASDITAKVVATVKS